MSKSHFSGELAGLFQCACSFRGYICAQNISGHKFSAFWFVLEGLACLLHPIRLPTRIILQ